MGIIIHRFCYTQQTDNPLTTITVDIVSAGFHLWFPAFFYPLTYAIKSHLSQQSYFGQMSVRLGYDGLSLGCC